MNGTTSKNIAPYIVAGIVSVFLIIIAFMMFFVPKMAESRDLSSRAATAKTNNVALTAKAEKLEAVANNLDPLKKQVEAFTSSFTTAAEQKNMIDAINAAGISSGVRVTILNPNVPAPREVTQEPDGAAPAAQAQPDGTSLPGAAPVNTDATQPASSSTARLGTVTLKIDGEGDLDAVQAFLVKAENLKRPVLVHELHIDEKIGAPYHVSLGMEIFMSAPLVEPKAATGS
jgi:Na+-transporting methylmalonyl-CoA/oxaloacetate decarboxylase gamma subunit